MANLKFSLTAALSALALSIPVTALAQDEAHAEHAMREHHADSMPAPITIESVTEALGLSQEVAEEAAFHVGALAEVMVRVVHEHMSRMGSAMGEHEMHNDSAMHGAGQREHMAHMDSVMGEHEMHMDSAMHGDSEHQHMARMDSVMGEHEMHMDSTMREGGEHEHMANDEHRAAMEELHESAMAHHGHIDALLSEEQKATFREMLHGWLEAHGVMMMGEGESGHEGNSN